MIVLDTHALLWWLHEPDRLGAKATAAIAAADTLGVPAIACWEVALLVQRRRYELALPMGEWLAAVRSLPRVHILALTAETAVLAAGLAMHPDPADRFIVATALQERARLVSKDALIAGLPFVDVVW